jgi:hypothetical protein
LDLDKPDDLAGVLSVEQLIELAQVARQTVFVCTKCSQHFTLLTSGDEATERRLWANRLFGEPYPSVYLTFDAYLKDHPPAKLYQAWLGRKEAAFVKIESTSHYNSLPGGYFSVTLQKRSNGAILVSVGDNDDGLWQREFERGADAQAQELLELIVKDAPLRPENLRAVYGLQ